MPQQPLIVGNPVLVVVDMQEGGAMPGRRSGHPAHARRAERVDDRRAAAGRRPRSRRVPVVFFQEVHRPSGVDFGRELDGTEGVHCVEGDPAPSWSPRCARPPGRVPHRQAPLLRFHRNGVRDRAARPEGVDADPDRRPHRRLRALHVRRRPPARLLRPRRHRLRRRLVRVPPRRVARRHGVPADRCAAAPATRSSPRSRSCRHLEPDTRTTVLEGAPDDHEDVQAAPVTAGGRRRARAGACAAVAAASGGGSTPNAAPTDKVLHLSFLQDPGQPPDPDIYYAGQGLLLTTNTLRGPAAVQGGHRQAGTRAAAGHRVDGLAGQQGVHLQAARRA